MLLAMSSAVIPASPIMSVDLVPDHSSTKMESVSPAKSTTVSPAPQTITASPVQKDTLSTLTLSPPMPTSASLAMILVQLATVMVHVKLAKLLTVPFN